METEEDGKGEVVKGLSRDAMIFEEVSQSWPKPRLCCGLCGQIPDGLMHT